MNSRIAWVVLPLSAVLACDDDPSTSPTTLAPDSPAYAEAAAPQSSAVLDAINVRLAADGADVRVGMAEYVTSDMSGELGQTLVAHNVGNKELGHHFVSGDPRRGGGTNITYIIDTVDGATATLSVEETTPQLDAAMATWEAEPCGDPAITSLGAVATDLGFVQFQLGMGGVQGWAADITHAGWLPRAFFDAVRQNGGASILGVTFTFLWVDGTGNFTDIDGDGRLDTAFREIYYNDGFVWRVELVQPNAFDVQTVALHEVGHALSQGHFGRLVRFEDTGRLLLSPNAVMNAAIASRFNKRELQGSDIGGHRTNWGSW